MLFRSNDTATTEIYTTEHTLSLHDALPILSDAVTNAVRAKNVTLLLRPDAALFAQPAADITTSITAELDRLVPTVGITPPAGWQPNQQGQQGGAAAAAPAAPARGAPARTQPQGR